MTGYLIYLLGLLVVAGWSVHRPRPGAKALLRLAWLGLACSTHLLPQVADVLPALLRLPLRLSADPGGLLAFSEWLGAIILLRVLVGLTAWDRPWRRRERVWAGCFVLALVLAPFVPTPDPFEFLLGPWVVPLDGSWLIALLPLPWLLSFRWQDRLGRYGLLAATATALIALAVLATNLTFYVDPRWADGRFHVGAGFRMKIEGAPVETDFLAVAWAMRGNILVYAFLCLLLAPRRWFKLPVRRISVRMVASHLLAGLLPAVLVAVFLLIGGALHLATYRSKLAVRYLERVATEIRDRLAEEFAAEVRLSGPGPGRLPDRKIIVLREGDHDRPTLGGPFRYAAADSLLLADGAPPPPLLLIGPALFVRARLDTVLAGEAIRGEAIVPADSLLLAEISRLVGCPVRIKLALAHPGEEMGFHWGQERPVDAERGSLGPDSGSGRPFLGVSFVSCLLWSEGAWTMAWLPVYSYASFGETILTLFAGGPRERFEMLLPKTILWLVTILLVCMAWLVGLTVYGMSRTITRAAVAMTRATNALGEGDFAHRIAIEGTDELWSVAGAFNTMADGLQRMRQMELAAERVEQELEIARRVQQNLFPADLPRVERWSLAGVCRPAREVGGDYYDVFALDSGEIALAIGDVAGKGLGPALVMSSVHTMVRTTLPGGEASPAGLLARINDHLAASTSAEMFMTLFVGVLDPATGQLRYANGGHCPPLQLSGDGREPALLTTSGLAVGILPGIAYAEGLACLEVGDVLVLVSDGVTEAVDQRGEMFEDELLLAVLAATQPCAEAQAVLARVLDEVDRFAGGAEQADDISILVVSRRG